MKSARHQLTTVQMEGGGGGGESLSPETLQEFQEETESQPNPIQLK